MIPDVPEVVKHIPKPVAGIILELAAIAANEGQAVGERGTEIGDLEDNFLKELQKQHFKETDYWFLRD